MTAFVLAETCSTTDSKYYKKYSHVCPIFAHCNGITNPKTALVLATNDFLMPFNVAVSITEDILDNARLLVCNSVFHLK